MRRDTLAMRCKNCGSENDDNLYICQNCGSPLYDEDDENDAIKEDDLGKTRVAPVVPSSQKNVQNQHRGNQNAKNKQNPKKEKTVIIFDEQKVDKLSKLDEQRLYNILYVASKDGVLESKEFQKWCNDNYRVIEAWFDRVINSERKNLISTNKIEVKSGRRKYVATNELKQEAEELLGLKRFLLEYTLIGRREPIEVKLFEEYLVFAQMMGIAEQVAKELGITVEEIKKISEIDSEKTVEDNEKENLEKDKDPDKEKKTLSKKQVESISTKQEIKTEQKVTDKDTMASLLNVQGKGYRKIAIVYSDKFKEAGNTTKFSFVGIKQDGSAEKIDTIEQAYGTNPTKNVHSVNRDGSKIEEEKVNSIFKIKGKTETQIAVDIGNMGTIEPSLVRTPAQDNEEAISIPIETSNIRPTTRETRELMNRNRNTRVKEEIQRIETHEELGCEDFSIKDIDDNPNNNTHEHQEFSEEYLDKCASEILSKSETIANTYNSRDVKAYLKRSIENGNETIDTEDLINNVSEEMEQEAEKEHPLHQNTDRD